MWKIAYSVHFQNFSFTRINILKIKLLHTKYVTYEKNDIVRKEKSALHKVSDFFLYV